MSVRGRVFLGCAFGFRILVWWVLLVLASSLPFEAEEKKKAVAEFAGLENETQIARLIRSIETLNEQSSSSISDQSPPPPPSMTVEGVARVHLDSSGVQKDWAAFGGDHASDHYSPLAQINRSNVKQLIQAWSFDTGEIGGLQSSPLIVDGVLFGISPTQKIFSLDARNGKLLWRFDSGIRGTQPDRGLAYWSNSSEKRILVGIMNFLYALDATTG